MCSANKNEVLFKVSSADLHFAASERKHAAPLELGGLVSEEIVFIVKKQTFCCLLLKQSGGDQEFEKDR